MENNFNTASQIESLQAKITELRAERAAAKMAQESAEKENNFLVKQLEKMQEEVNFQQKLNLELIIDNL